jgi:hypothetical protein
MDWSRTPNNLQDSFDNWPPLNDRKYNLKLYSLAMVLWVLWNVRNKIVMEGVFPADALFKIHANLQRWKGRLKPEDGEQMTTEAVRVQVWVQVFLEERKGQTQTSIFCNRIT